MIFSVIGLIAVIAGTILAFNTGALFKRRFRTPKCQGENPDDYSGREPRRVVSRNRV